MSKPADHEGAVPAASFITRLHDWWRYHNELGNLPRPLTGEDHIRLTLQGHHEDTHTCCLTPLRAMCRVQRAVPPPRRGR